MEGVWREPLGIQNFEIHRLGLALGINLVTLLPSFGLTGEIQVKPPGRTPIQAGVTICIDVANPATTVFEVHFSRLLLQDIANVFMGREVSMPKQIGEMGFPDEVRIFISPAGNLDCFGRAYDAGVEIKGTFQIPFLQVYASADIKVKLKPTFQLKAELNLRPINYGNGLLKIVSAQSDSVGAYLKMNIGSADEFLINGSCRVINFFVKIMIIMCMVCCCAVWYMIQYSTVQYSTVQYSTVQYSMLLWCAGIWYSIWYGRWYIIVWYGISHGMVYYRTYYIV